MKLTLSVIFILVSFILNGQIITTYESTGVNEIQCLAIDHYGNLFITTYGNQIKKIDTNHVVTLIAGTGTAGFSGDGDSAINAELHTPLGITVDSLGNIYFADDGNNRIRKIDINTQIITTIAGDSTFGGPGSFSGDSGLATHATLYYPQGVCFDNNGNLFISDSRNYRIRKVDMSGIITTYAGNGLIGSVGDGGNATAAKCWPTEGIVFDNSGNLYFTQIITYPTIRKVSADGIITTFAGDTVSHVYNGDGIPATNAYMNAQYLALSQHGLVYFCDEAANNRVRYIDSFGVIHTLVGNGADANAGDGGPATAAEIAGPTGIAFDACGNLYIGDFDGNSIREVIYDTPCLYVPTKVPELHTNQVTIYPNPCAEELYIDNIKSETGYVLFNIKSIMEQTGILKEGSNQLNISNLPTGIHFLQITAPTGERVVRKVVKE